MAKKVNSSKTNLTNIIKIRMDDEMYARLMQTEGKVSKTTRLAIEEYLDKLDREKRGVSAGASDSDDVSEVNNNGNNNIGKGGFGSFGTPSTPPMPMSSLPGIDKAAYENYIGFCAEHKLNPSVILNNIVAEIKREKGW